MDIDNSPISILILDDDKEHNNILKNMLLKEDSFLVEIESKIELLEQSIKKSQPNILIIGLEFNEKYNNFAKAIWYKFMIAIIFTAKKYNKERHYNSLVCEPYGVLYRPINNYQAKMTIEIAHHKHTIIEIFFKTIRKPINNIIYIEGGFKLDSGQLILYKADKKILLTKNEQKLLFITSSFSFKISPIDIVYNFIYRNEFYELNKLRNLIYRLRKKLGYDIFETHVNIGYKLKIINKLEKTT